MHIEYLQTARFRNLEDLELRLSPRVVVIEGQNAQGKTNLLEALYVCATGRSFRNAAPRELIRHGAADARVHAVFSRHGVRHEVEVVLHDGRRTLRVDGRGVRQLGKLLELLNVVAFFPDDLRIIKGSPEERRRFLDRAVANHHPEFYAAALAYARVLRSRNALLKAAERFDAQMLAVYNQQLVDYGARIHVARQRTLASLAPLAARHFARIMSPDVDMTLRLRSGVIQGDDLTDPATFAAAMASALRDAQARDRAAGATTVGPHRADVLVGLAGRDARLYASQGQQRSCVLALKLAEVESLTQALGCVPILLLDDVSSELDRERTAHLMTTVSAIDSQVWISTTAAALLGGLRASQLLRVVAGQVTEIQQ